MIRPPQRRSLILIGLLVLLGCHRAHYREQADIHAHNLIREKSHPHWPLDDLRIHIDPRSRMFDPFDPDRVPMPPDDPVAHELMHHVDGKKGYAHWHANGGTLTVENPCWTDHLPLDENGVLNLSAELALELALVHSRTYQREHEELYLSALDVSAERFRFDTQFFGGHSTFYTVSGQNRTPRSELDLSTFTNQTGRLGLPSGGVTAPSAADVLMRKSFATGADLAVGFANSLMWEFAGPDDHSAFSIVDLSVIQPLLRAAGKDRILEQLTISERALLANVRQMERFRRAFYVDVMTGVDAGDGANRRGGFFGAAGLGGFTGVGGGGFGRIGGGFGGGGGANQGLGGGGAGAGQVDGYLGLLQTLQDIRNQQATIVGLRSNLVQLRASYQENLTRIPEDVETLVRERLQIAQARQALLNAESRLLNTQAGYQTTLDTFKISPLGLPPQLCVSIEDSLVDPFNLIDPQILVVQNSITNLRESVAAINEQLLRLAGGTSGDAQTPLVIPWSDELANRLNRLRQHVVRFKAVLEQISTHNLAFARQDIQRLIAALPQRLEQQIALREKYEQDPAQFARYNNLDPCQEILVADIDPSVFDVARLESAPQQLQAEMDRLQNQFAKYDDPINKVAAYLDSLLGVNRPDQVDYSELEQAVIFAVPGLLTEVSADVLDLQLVQARARADTVDLTPIDLSWDMAVEIARQYRRDWMNQRTGLVDAWRLIEFNADNLESNLDLIFEADVQNEGDNPLRLQTTSGQMRVGLRFDAPITRLQERNTYRQALIEYQQARRTFYLFEDTVARALRGTLRTIDLNRVNFEELRVAVLSAIDQVVLNDQIQKLREERGLEAGVTAARDVVSALADLQTAQNDFLSVWLDYERQRMLLDLNLGTMNLDPYGGWIDPGPIGPEAGYPAPFGCSGEAELILDPDHYFQPNTPTGSQSEGDQQGDLPPAPPGAMSASVIQSSFLEAVGAQSGEPAPSRPPAMQRLPAVHAPAESPAARH